MWDSYNFFNIIFQSYCCATQQQGPRPGRSVFHVWGKESPEQISPQRHSSLSVGCRGYTELQRGLQSSTIWAAAESAPVEQSSKRGGKKTVQRWPEAILTVWELKRNEAERFKVGLLLFYFPSSANDDPTLHLLCSDLTMPLLATTFLPFW